MAVTALIRIKCHAGKGGQLREALSVPMQLTRENPQCSRIELLGPSDDADGFVLLEDSPARKSSSSSPLPSPSPDPMALLEIKCQ